MSSSYFMEDLYFGVFNEEVFRSFRLREPSARLEKLLNEYRTMLKTHDPDRFEKEGRLPSEMLDEMGRMGFFGINVPIIYGGLGFNLREYLEFIEEAVKLDLSTALVFMAHTSLAGKVLLLFADEAQKERYLRPAAIGRMILGFGLTEPDRGSDARNIETTAELSKEGTHYVLNGRKTYITNANYAQAFTIFAQMDPEKPGHMGVFIVHRDWEGVEVGADMPKMGLKASSTASIQLKDVRVPAENLVGKPGEGFKIAMTILNYGRLKLGAASAGLMDQSLEDMKKRAETRIQFGRPIKEFPLIQEKLVQARVRSFVCTAMNDFTAELLEKQPKLDLAVETSHCKLYGTTRAWDTLYDAQQVAGGAGYLSTQPYEKRLRDMRVATVFEGTTEIHSIYPPLFILRKFDHKMREQGKGFFSKALQLLKVAYRRAFRPSRFADRELRKAFRLARSNAKTLKKMLCLGALVHGKHIGERQFLLRRITRLSTATYGLFAVLARLSSQAEKDRIQDRDRVLLRYVMEEVKEEAKVNTRLFGNRKEKIHQSVVRELFSTTEE